jgi:hypothetical protein
VRGQSSQGSARSSRHEGKEAVHLERRAPDDASHLPDLHWLFDCAPALEAGNRIIRDAMYWLPRAVVRHRHQGGDDARLQPRSAIGVEDHVANAADFAEARQQRRLQHLAVEHRVDAGGVAEPADLLADDAEQAETARQYHRDVGGEQRRALCLLAGEPLGAGLARSRLAGVFHEEDQRAAMVMGGLVAAAGGVEDVGINGVDAGREGVRLAGLGLFAQRVDDGLRKGSASMCSAPSRAMPTIEASK